MMLMWRVTDLGMLLRRAIRLVGIRGRMRWNRYRLSTLLLLIGIARRRLRVRRGSVATVRYHCRTRLDIAASCAASVGRRRRWGAARAWGSIILIRSRVVRYLLLFVP